MRGDEVAAAAGGEACCPEFAPSDRRDPAGSSPGVEGAVLLPSAPCDAGVPGTSTSTTKNHNIIAGSFRYSLVILPGSQPHSC